ncbi:MAG: hypothetical protein RI917_228 [Actinomycetota bacterium]
MSFTVPTSVTIPANGCATLNIPYRMNKKFSSPIVYAYVALVSKKNSFATSEYILPSLSTTEAGTNPHVSTEKLRLCSVSEPYINDYGDKVTPVAVKTGTYSLTVSYTKMKPKFLSIKSKTYLVNVTVK